MKNKLPEGVIRDCIVCGEYVMVTDDKFMIALEQPYLNLYVHKHCYNEIEGNLDGFLSENLEKYLKTTPN